MALYEIKANDGTKLTWDYNYIQEATAWEGTVWSVDCYEMDNGESVSVFYAGDFYDKALASDKLLPGKDVILSGISALAPLTSRVGISERAAKVSTRFMLQPMINLPFSVLTASSLSF